MILSKHALINNFITSLGRTYTKRSHLEHNLDISILFCHKLLARICSEYRHNLKLIKAYMKAELNPNILHSRFFTQQPLHSRAVTPITKSFHKFIAVLNYSRIGQGRRVWYGLPSSVHSETRSMHREPDQINILRVLKLRFSIQGRVNILCHDLWPLINLRRIINCIVTAQGFYAATLVAVVAGW